MVLENKHLEIDFAEPGEQEGVSDSDDTGDVSKDNE